MPGDVGAPGMVTGEVYTGPPGDVGRPGDMGDPGLPSYGVKGPKGE